MTAPTATTTRRSRGAELPVLEAAVAVLLVLPGLTLLAALLIAIPIRTATRRES